MTLIDTRIMVPNALGGLDPARGVMVWTPTRRRNLAGQVILPKPFTVDLADGDGSVEVEPSTVEWAWRVQERFYGVADRTVTYAVPATGPVAYTDLVQLDPATLEPDAEPEAAWWAAIETLSLTTLTEDPDNPGLYLIGA